MGAKKMARDISESAVRTCGSGGNGGVRFLAHKHTGKSRNIPNSM